MFTVPADVKLVRHLPMKGPRQVKQVVFPLLTAGSSSPEFSELQPNPDVLGLLHQDLAGCGQPVLSWVSLSQKDNDYINPGEGFVDSVNVLLTWNCWVRYSHLNSFCLPEIPQALSCLVGTCDPLSEQWRRKHFSRDTFSLVDTDSVAIKVLQRASSQSCSSNIIWVSAKAGGLWGLVCSMHTNTILWYPHWSRGKTAGKSLWFQHSEGKYLCASSQDRAKPGKSRHITKKT